MADGLHFENRYIAISRWKIIGFSWNFVHSSRFWTGWTSRDQKWKKSCIGQTPSSTERISCLFFYNFWQLLEDFNVAFCHVRFNEKIKDDERRVMSHNQLGQRLVRWYDLTWLLKVNNFGTNEKTVCGFLVVDNSNLGTIMHRFIRHNCIQMCKNRWFHTRNLLSFNAFVCDDLCKFMRDLYIVEIYRYGAIFLPFTVYEI